MAIFAPKGTIPPDRVGRGRDHGLSHLSQALPQGSSCLLPSVKSLSCSSTERRLAPYPCCEILRIVVALCFVYVILDSS